MGHETVDATDINDQSEIGTRQARDSLGSTQYAVFVRNLRENNNTQTL